MNPLRVHKRTINQNTSRRVQRDNFAQRMAREWVGAGPGDNGPKGGGGRVEWAQYEYERKRSVRRGRRQTT